uniref:Uncharacterized protein MANES_10G077600 n=1 Tax=Rhizophora mucronata TaxID=61149 RepID=A0A2P2MB08_RHIMU
MAFMEGESFGCYSLKVSGEKAVCLCCPLLQFCCTVAVNFVITVYSELNGDFC